MNRLLTTLVAASSGLVLLTGCGETDLTRVSATPTSAPTPGSPSSSPASSAAPVGSPAKPAAVATSRPSNAVSWQRPVMSDEDLDHGVRAAWAAAHKVPVSKVRGEQLMNGLADNGGLLVGAYQLWTPGGRAYVVVAQGEPRSEAVIVSDQLARPDLTAVASVVRGRTSHVVAAIAPGTAKVEYRPRAAAAWTAIDQDSINVIFPRGRDAAAGEAVRTTRNGTRVVVPVASRSGASAPASAAPSNALAWPARGDASAGPSVAVVARAYAKAMGVEKAEVRTLFSADTDGRVRYLVGQAWVPGKPAQTIGYVERPGREGELHIQPVTARGTRVVAFLVTEQPGTTTDLLVVVPEPRTTQVSYRASGSSPWRPAYSDVKLDGVNLVDRAKSPADDSLQIMTGNGDPNAASTLVVRVSKVLCNGSSCS